MPRLPIYMDGHATTQLDPRVLEAMLPYLTERFGNAASRNHRFGWEAGKAVERARQQVADLIGATPKEVVFTSGATESDNLAIKGIAATHRDKGQHLITVATEHRAVLDSCRRLEHDGFRVTYLGVRSDGLVDLDVLERSLEAGTVLISVMAANNEIGVIQPLDAIGRVARARGILFHTDAAQACGRIPMDVDALQVDLLSISAHKLHGPKGVGALYVRSRRPRVHLTPLVDGGGHERGLRSGTLNVPAIVGFGVAADLCVREMSAEAARVGQLRDRLKDGLLQGLEHVCVNGSLVHRLPNNLNVSIGGVDGESLHMAIDDVAVSSGAACSSAAVEPSHVLRALGVPDDLAHASIRFGLGRFNTEEEVDYVVEKIAGIVTHLRATSRLVDVGSAEEF